MALMTAAQTATELKRKASLGIAPTNSANQAQYNQIKASVTPIPATTTPKVSSSTSASSVSKSASASSYTVPYSNITDINELKNMYNNAKAAGSSQAALDAIHNQADTVRGYKTDPSGTYQLGTKYKSGNTNTTTQQPQVQETQPLSNVDKLKQLYDNWQMSQSKDDYINQAKTTAQSQYDTSVSGVNTDYSSAIEKIKQAYANTQNQGNSQMEQLKQQYNKYLSDIDMQKALNEQKRREQMANQGLLDTMTDQVAINTSAENSANNARIAQENEINEIKNKLLELQGQQNTSVGDIESQKAKQLAQLKQMYDNAVNSAGSNYDQISNDQREKYIDNYSKGLDYDNKVEVEQLKNSLEQWKENMKYTQPDANTIANNAQKMTEAMMPYLKVKLSDLMQNETERYKADKPYTEMTAKEQADADYNTAKLAQEKEIEAEKLKAQQDYNSGRLSLEDYRNKVAMLNAQTNANNSGINADDYNKTINDTYVYVDPDTKARNVDSNGIMQYVKTLGENGVPKNITDALLTNWGIKIYNK